MSIIEELKEDLRHQPECAALYEHHQRQAESHELFNDDVTDHSGCNCSRRRKIAWLERLEEPTQRMNEVGQRHSAYGSPLPALLCGVLKAAEEDLL